MKRDPRRQSPQLSQRLEQARRIFQQHHAQVEPDAAFADRVATKLQRPPAELMGGIALRLLPATLAVVVLLAWIALQPVPTIEGSIEYGNEATEAELSTTDDPLLWVLEQAENG